MYGDEYKLCLLNHLTVGDEEYLSECIIIIIINLYCSSTPLRAKYGLCVTV